MEATMTKQAQPTYEDLVLALRGFLEWYRALPEPGLVPHSLEIGQRLRETRALLARVQS